MSAPVDRPAGTTSLLSPEGLTSPLVGREAELQGLRAVLARARDYHAPQLVTLLGNRGTGKTRLVAAFAAEITAPARLFHGRARPGLKYGAIAELLRARLGIGEHV